MTVVLQCNLISGGMLVVAVLRVGSDGGAAMQPNIRRHASGRCIESGQ